MSDEGMSKQEARRYLAAFADGELDVEQNLRVLEQMAMDSTNTQRVLHQHQLRRATRHAMDRPEHACPERLREQMSHRLANEPPAAAGDRGSPREDGASKADQPDAQPHAHGTGRQVHLPRRRQGQPTVIARIGQWVPAAAAAVLLIVALVSLYSMRDQLNAAGRSPVSALVSEARYDEFEGRHELCSADPSKLFETVDFTRDIEQLPGEINDYLAVGSGPVPGHLIDSLNLSVLGYDFLRAGACVVPGVGSVHIVYRAAEPNGQPRPPSASASQASIHRTGTDHSASKPNAESPMPKALSLWVKMDEGNYGIQPGRIYRAGGEEGQPPLLIWKEMGRVYFLIGDVPTDVRKAARIISKHEKPRP